MGAPTADEVRAAARRIQDRAFSTPSAVSRFLEYTVARALEGDSAALKESLLGEYLFNRRAFDPRLDPIVRVTASRLRARLNEYYTTAGRDETVLIEYPKGSYAPVFSLRSEGQPVAPLEANESESGLDVEPGRLPVEGAAPALAEPVRPPLALAARPRAKWLIAGVAAAAAIALLASGWRNRPWEPRPGPPPVALQVAASPDAPYDFQEKGSVALSRDGAYLATLIRSDDGTTAADLRVTVLSTSESRLVPSLRGVLHPFWSPDGRRIGGHLNGRLVHAAIDGGPVTSLCDSDIYSGSGGTWSPTGEILFSSAEGLRRTTASGGGCATVTSVDRSQGETAHRWPYFLPDGEHFLYTVAHQKREKQGIHIASVHAPRQSRWLTAADSSAAFAATGAEEGVLLYVANGDLMEVPVDGRTLTVKGEPKVAAKGVGVYAFSGSADFTVSANGVLAYRANPSPARELVWVDRKGNKSPAGAGSGLFRYPDINPAGDAIAVESITWVNVESEVWAATQGKPSRITVEPGQEIGPVWSPAGDAIAYAKDMNLVLLDVPGGKVARKLVEGNVRYPSSWSAGRIAYTAESPGTGLDVCVVEVNDPARRECIAGTTATENRGSLSPDGNWIAYSSIENGEYAVLIASVEPGPERRKVQISSPRAIGLFPRWARNGKEIFFVQAGFLVTVSVDASRAELKTGSPVSLFRAPFYNGGFGYSAAPDGSRFVFSLPAGGERTRPGPVNVIVNRFPERR